MGGGGTESFLEMHHTCTHAHNTQTHKHKHTAIGVAGGVLTVLYQSLDIPLEAGTRGISVDQRSNILLFLAKPLGTDVYGMDGPGGARNWRAANRQIQSDVTSSNLNARTVKMVRMPRGVSLSRPNSLVTGLLFVIPMSSSHANKSRPVLVAHSFLQPEDAAACCGL